MSQGKIWFVGIPLPRKTPSLPTPLMSPCTALPVVQSLFEPPGQSELIIAKLSSNEYMRDQVDL